MIPNLKNDPWKNRIYDKRHVWINKKGLKIKPAKEID
jgi:hypothetical protein